MSSHKPREGLPPDSPSDVRPLPARPNLEFERKQAKKLLAAVHEGDADALVRVRAKHRASAGKSPDEVQLSDAQFTIAREYGFTSWPRLVEYFETLSRHELSGLRERHTPLSHHESWARTLIVEHKEKRPWTVRFFGAYVPRFYGRTADQILASDVTVDDAQLATARMYRYPSWEAMAADTPAKPDAWEEQETPLRKAMAALRAGDLQTLEQLTQQYPELLSPTEREHPRSDTLARNVLLMDVKQATEQTRQAYDWLRARMDLQATLNWMLLGYMRMTVEEMQRLLDRGADPAWIPPNGYSVIEHVIWRCWNGEIVDLIAKRVTPPSAMWISAGLGDANGVRQYFDANGQLTDAARQNRPDFNALGFIPTPSLPAEDDEGIIWEAFLIAAFNQRFEVMDALLERGFNIDYIGWGQTMLHTAVGNGWLPLVEYLVKRGANVNLKGWRPYATAREMAEEAALNPYGYPNGARILELVGGRDIETLRAARDAKRKQRVMPTSARVEDAFNFAKHDAVTRGKKDVDIEGLFIGLLHEAGLPVAMLGHAGVDLKKLREPIRDRIDALLVKVPEEMTASPEAASILMDARMVAEERKEEHVTPLHVFYAVMKRASPGVLNLIESAGSTREKVVSSLERVLPPVETRD
jgi:hypothetical protein